MEAHLEALLIEFFFPFCPSDSNLFWRYQTTLLTPSTTSIAVTPSSSELEGLPGEVVNAAFLIHNFGEPAEISVDVTDSLGYFVFVDPTVSVRCRNIYTVCEIPHEYCINTVQIPYEYCINTV